MVPLIQSGQEVTVVPLTQTMELQPKDIVLCTVGAQQYLHLIKACAAGRYQIGNNRGRINGWVSRENIHGKLTEIRP